MRRFCQAAALCALVVAVACDSRADVHQAEAARRSALATADSALRDVVAGEPFKLVSTTEVGRARAVMIDLRCSDEGQTLLTLTRLSRTPGEAFVTTVAPSATTRVVWQVDTLPVRDLQWTVGGVGQVVAFAPTPVSAAMELRAAKKLRLAYWPYGGDSTELVLDVSAAAARVDSVARACRWPA
jgi:hypothetical protein